MSAAHDLNPTYVIQVNKSHKHVLALDFGQLSVYLAASSEEIMWKWVEALELQLQELLAKNKDG